MLINGHEFKFGADPEVFVKRNNMPISAYGMIPGTKDAPHKVDFGAVQVDGMALEFNIDPALNKKQWEKNLSSVMSTLGKMISPEDVLTIEPTMEFGLDYISQQPDEAKELGCNPDFNAYTGEVNPKPNGEVGFRTAAGHIHIGWTENENPMESGHFEACKTLTKHMDACLGILSVLEDDDVKRRQMYGMAGAFRPKPYGVEYRVLSNYWIKNKEMRSLVWDRTKYIIKRTFTDPIGERNLQYARDAINNSDVNKARHFADVVLGGVK